MLISQEFLKEIAKYQNIRYSYCEGVPLGSSE